MFRGPDDPVFVARNGKPLDQHQHGGRIRLGVLGAVARIEWTQSPLTSAFSIKRGAACEPLLGGSGCLTKGAKHG
jgi:hypothetical protein